MLWLLPIFPALGGLIVFTAGRHWPRPALAGAAVAVMAATLALAALAVTAGWTGELAWSRHLVLTGRLDAIAATLALLVPAVGLPVVLFAAFHEERPGLARLMALLMLFVGAMELLVAASDLLTLVIGWELVGACSWALIAHDWRGADAPRDAAVAFLSTRLGDLGLFVAAMTVFAGTGSFAFDALDDLEDAALVLAAGGILVAAAAKSAQLPFAFWLFNAMSGPSSASALLHAATMVAAGAYLIARLHPVLDQVAWFAPVTMAVGLATAMAGGLVAVLQPHAKKLLAASTSAHYGFMFIAAGAGYPAVAVLHLVMHAWLKAPLFLAAGIVTRARHTHLLALLAPGRPLPVTAVLTAVAAAALAGLPPLGAAWTKEMVSAAAGHSSSWLAAGVLAAGALSAAYAARWQTLALGPRELTGEREDANLRWPLAALAMAAAFTLASSLIWLAPLHDAVGTWYGAHLPSPAGWERAAMLALLGAGVYAGYRLARDDPHLGRRRRSWPAAQWLGLPVLMSKGIERPAIRLAAATARFDDAILDRAIMSLAGAFRRGAALMQHADDGWLDRGVQSVARTGRGLAGWGRSVAEAVADGAVDGIARLILGAGADVVRLQSGLAHHYLVWLATGAAVLATIILIN